ncbi:hypothetical protein ACHM2J_12380 [Clostridium perfringens]|uniref:hypothetical protein n=2 Tax=Clostridium perfringens TaxID=1502 RepID=UPI0018AC165B|nr:hypothetical protein [Clostridium perfringens]ELC8402409.1 hypothetical protein [Clostridium perfringens]MDK0855777.1 hypothetical protein [Clostridium perfringens]MDM0926941.1 hypothetical protein [Clostridium perfringens]MDU1811176.1 hypothetical protein [Clostridium perfringens]
MGYSTYSYEKDVDVYMIIIAIVWLIFAFSCSKIAEGKGYGKGIWFVLGIMFGILALGVAVFLPNKNTAKQ